MRVAQVALLVGFSLCASPVMAGTVAPAYDPGFWNASNRIGVNNCYNYATNKASTNGLTSQPGRAYYGYDVLSTGNMTCDTVRTFASLDGTLTTNGGQPTFVYWSPNDPVYCPTDKGAKMALVVAPGFDYHWYRVDSFTNNMWSHKRGRTMAKNWDESGQPIYSIETADRVEYTDVCGYFCGYSASTNQNTGVITIR
jgi:hypothetical protein